MLIDFKEFGISKGIPKSPQPFNSGLFFFPSKCILLKNALKKKVRRARSAALVFSCLRQGLACRNGDS